MGLLHQSVEKFIFVAVKASTIYFLVVNRTQNNKMTINQKTWADAIFRRWLPVLLLGGFLVHVATVQAGGVALGSTRIIYSAEKKQASLPVSNSDKESVFLIQSWVESVDGKKSADFIVTPPLFMIKANSENTLRLMFAGAALPQDRETVYWLNVKAIPSLDKEKQKNTNTLQLAVVSRIKVFYRPVKLPMPADTAAERLTFERQGNQLTLTNPTPYYITMVNVRAGEQDMPGVMVAPMGKQVLALPNAKTTLSYQTINDYGAISPVRRVAI